VLYLISILYLTLPIPSRDFLKNVITLSILTIGFLFLKKKFMKHLLYSCAVISTVIFLSSCKKRIEICAEFNELTYTINDTILLDATCSENVETYLWEPQAGLQMLGSGTEVTERFIVLPLTGAVSRTVNLTVSNGKSTKKISKSAVVL
jgi:hypothetical protein